MSPSRLPSDVQQLIDRHLDSAAQVEVLVALVRSVEPRSVEHISRELGIDPAHAHVQLDKLVGLGLVVNESNAYRYLPRDQRTGETVLRLVELFSTHRVAIITAVYSTPEDRLRDFSDAFKLRKDKTTDG